MPAIKVGLVGTRDKLGELLQRFGRFEFVRICGVVDIAGGSYRAVAGELPEITVFNSVDEMIGLQGLRFLVADRESAGAVNKANYTPFGVTVVTPAILEKFLVLIHDHGELMKLFQDMELMQIILNNVQEGIQYANKDGHSLYVNSAFTKITGIEPRKRIGSNVFSVSRDGALVKALQTKQPVFGLRNTATNSKAEVVSNASPIFEGNEVLGAVVVFRDISDIMKLTRELKQSNKIIASLNTRLQHYQRHKFVFDDIICESENMRVLKERAQRMALSDSTVLIQGESGTGKELFAHAIHHTSKRSDWPFVEVNCASIPENLMESELFGHEKGAFTGADRRKLGRFDIAEGGTIFLDEIGELKPEMQAKLLRVLQSKEYDRVGGTATITADVRVITATNKDLRAMAAAGEFREDLYYRLNVLLLEVPPLRHRVNDVTVLARHLLKKISARTGMYTKGIEPEALDLLKQYTWPGNVRELENLLERVLYYEEGDYITLKSISIHLGPFIKKGMSNGTAPQTVVSLEEAERQAVVRALDFYGRTVDGKRRAAKALGISLAGLYNRLKKYGIT